MSAATSQRHERVMERLRNTQRILADTKKAAKMPKADVLLSESRVRIVSCDEDSCTAFVQGDHDAYRVRIYRDDMGREIRECSCIYSANFHPIAAGCSHVKAVQKVFALEPKPNTRGPQEMNSRRPA